MTVNSFFDDYIKKNCTMEDEFTGEVIEIQGVKNPLRLLEYAGKGTPIGESVKPALAYQYVEAIKAWMVPDKAETFSDLSSLHQFEADYVEVDPNIIDRSDPDCVFKEKFGKTYIWSPVYWMHAYAISSVPARGVQVAYNDSGEADADIPDILDGKLVFIKNNSPLAGFTEKQGFVKHYEDGKWGMHFTSNKTSLMNASYDVPWIPEPLAYWLVRLRKWQAKYNPIGRAMPWSECKRTDLNDVQRSDKGQNCFLFRAFGEEEPGHYSTRLAERLAAALFYTQPRGLTLATFVPGGSTSVLSRYESKFTPHSMRVSLITAYVMEFGLPIEIIMKLAGHSSVVMSIYYVRLNAQGLRTKMEEGEKLALQNQVYAAQRMFEQNRQDELIHVLVGNSEQALAGLLVGSPGSILTRDHGLCPYAASRCWDGGDSVGATQIRLPAPGGYLGVQNCLRCRHFVTGPVFLGGLLSLWNEISLRVRFLGDHHMSVNEGIQIKVHRIQILDNLESDTFHDGGIFDSNERDRLQVEIRKSRAEMEGLAMKVDTFLCDMQALTRMINQCKEILNRELQTDKKIDDHQVSLIVHAQNELEVDIEETSLFQQLNEVCLNSVIYESASADFACTRRAQMIDKIALMNKIRPVMCGLGEQQQLILGNQVTKFLLQRLKSWARVDQLVNGDILLEHLGNDERISVQEMTSLLASEALNLIRHEAS
jgi:hypothetical protein